MPAPGRYTVVKKVADGGMAEIFLATQTGAEGFEREVILKRILPAFSGDQQFRNMIVDEAHIAMTLHHGNIVQVLDLGEAEGRYFLVMELVDGWDLARVLVRAENAHHMLPLGLSLYVVAETCRALAYAHGKQRGGKPIGIVHRDISPQNVLVSEQGEVKLADFGIAKALGKRERTHAGIIKGKLDFMSPEQAAGGQLDGRSDIFSVGTLLYLLATGRRPFGGGNDLETLLRIQKCQYDPPEKASPSLSPQVAAVIRKAMQLPLAERYQSADEMMRDVETALRTEFSSVGQSELKRYLDELGRRDGAQPISRNPALPEEEASSGQGKRTLALQEAVAPGGLAMAETRLQHTPLPPGVPPSLPPLAALPQANGAPRNPPPLSPLPNSVGPPSPTPSPAPNLTPLRSPIEATERRRAIRRPSVIGTVVALAATAVVAAFVIAPDGARRLLTSARTRLSPAATTPAPAKKPASRPIIAQQPPPPPAADPSPALEAEPRAATEEKERDKERDRPHKSSSTKSVVTVRLSSRPSGATVKNHGGSVLGQTPLALSLKPGSTQHLTFTKSGYGAVTRKLSVGSSSQSVVVQLSREAARRARRR